MCLAIPGKLIEITQQLDAVFRMGKVSFDGIIKEVSLNLLPEAKVGQYVMVHVGAAISIIDEEEAKKTFAVLKQLDELEELEGPEMFNNNDFLEG
ncbi:MAG: HypC/HybG/HupF family hydrogenase formation chaperone [Flavobacteriaceae bacterium]|nr:HypC/HybG/HupF family hydrogenase formation chaperone [Flavobacteriaceae bacterium]